MQRFWDSAMALTPNDDDDDTRRLFSLKLFQETLVFFNILTHFWLCTSDSSLKLASDGGETGRSIPYLSSSMANTFSFKIQDKKGRMHRFTCGMQIVTCHHSAFNLQFPSNIWQHITYSYSSSISFTWMWMGCVYMLSVRSVVIIDTQRKMILWLLFFCSYLLLFDVVYCESLIFSKKKTVVH